MMIKTNCGGNCRWNLYHNDLHVNEGLSLECSKVRLTLPHLCNHIHVHFISMDNYAISHLLRFIEEAIVCILYHRLIESIMA